MIQGEITTNGIIWRTATVKLSTSRIDNDKKARIRNINIRWRILGSEIWNNELTDGNSGDSNEFSYTFGIESSVSSSRIEIVYSAQEFYYKKTTGIGTNYDNYFFKNYTGSGAIDGSNTTGPDKQIIAKDFYFNEHSGFWTRQLNATVGTAKQDLEKWFTAKFQKDSTGKVVNKVYQTSQPDSTFLVFDLFDSGNGRIIIARDLDKNNEIRSRAFWKDNSGAYTSRGISMEVATSSGGGSALELRFKWDINKKMAYIEEIDPDGNPNEKASVKFSATPSQVQIVLHNGSSLTDPVETIDKDTYSWELDSLVYSDSRTIIQGEDDGDDETDNIDDNGQPIPPTDPRYKPSFAYIIDESQFGIRFKQFGESTSIKKGIKRQISTNIKIINTENSPLPEFYDPNPNFTTEEPIDLTIFTADLVKSRRLQLIARKKLIYFYIPESWNLKIESGFYTFKSYNFGADRGDDIFQIQFKGMQRVNATGLDPNPTNWTYKSLAEFSSNLDTIGDSQLTYKRLSKFWSNYRDLADNF